AEAKARKKYSPDAKKALLEQLHNRGTREAEKLLLALSPGMAPTEKIRPLTPDKSQLTLVVSGQLLEKLERLKDAFCHKLKGGGYVELIERLTDSAIAELERKLKRDRDGAEPAEHNESTEQRNATS